MSDKIMQPVKNGVAKKVPVIMQMEALECGAASLTMVLAYYKKWIPLEQVRVDCGVSRDGSNAANVLKAARNYGLEAKGYRYEPERLKEKGTFPCIIHWNFNHFVVLRGFKGNFAMINDPAKGSVKIPMEEFDRSFTGICLMFSPGENFRPEGRRKSTLEFARKRLAGAAAAVALVVLTTIIGYLFEIINPVFSRFFVDRLLTGENLSLMKTFIWLMVLAGVLQITACCLQAYYTMKVNAKMDIVGSSTFLWKILRMPVEFFTQRRAGDIMNRHSTNATISNTLINTLVPLAFNIIMMLVYLVVMLRYSAIITLVGVTVVLINVFTTKLISDRRVNITRVQKRDLGKLNSSTVSGIQMIETIKASGAENGFFQKWAGYAASYNTQWIKYAKIEKYMGVLPAVLTGVANAAVLVIGVWLAMEGQFTIGMIMTFQGLMGSFMTPATNLLTASQ